MLLFICEMGVHWYFRFAVKTANNRVKLLKYKTLKQMQQHAPQLLIVVSVGLSCQKHPGPMVKELK